MIRAVVLVALLLSFAAEAGAQEPRTYAVVPVAGAGAWPPDVERVEKVVADALRRIADAKVLPRDDTIAQVEDARGMGVACAFEQPDCAARFGALAGVDRVAVVQVVPEAGALSATILLVDVRGAAVAGYGSARGAPKSATFVVDVERAVAAALDGAPPPAAAPAAPPVAAAGPPVAPAPAAASAEGAAPVEDRPADVPGDAPGGPPLAAVGLATAGLAGAGAAVVAGSAIAVEGLLWTPQTLSDREGLLLGGRVLLAGAAVLVAVAAGGAALWLLAPEEVP